MVGSLDDHLVRAHPVHLVEHALGLFIQIAFNAERRKFVRYHPHRPARAVFLRSAAVCAGAIGQNLRRCLALIAVTEGAETTLDPHGFAHKVGWPLGAICRNDHPSAHNGVFS